MNRGRWFTCGSRVATRWVGAAGVALVLTGGCSMPMSVSYSPVAAVETLAAESEGPRTFVARFSDNRPDKNRNRIGAMKNLYGTTLKELVTTDDFGTILAEATTDAFRKAGLKAELHLDRTASDTIPAAELSDYDMLVGGRMTCVEVESRPGWDTIKITARVVIDLYLKKKGSEQEWLGPIEGRAERREIGTFASQALTLALDSAIQDCMRNMIRHVKASGSIARPPQATTSQ